MGHGTYGGREVKANDKNLIPPNLKEVFVPFMYLAHLNIWAIVSKRV
jgi:hypothetical protein